MNRLNEEMAVAQIVLEHSECAGVFQRYRIDYCCKGEQPLAQACQQRGADPRQVLAELERAVADRKVPQGFDPRQVPTGALVQHIVSRHHRAMREALPLVTQLAKKVARVHGEHNPRLVPLRDAVEALSETLLPHMDDEERSLFPALRSEQPANETVKRELATMREDHPAMARLLEQIRGASEDFTVPEWACTSYTTLFRELKALEEDLFTHVHLENHVLMPRFVSKAA